MFFSRTLLFISLTASALVAANPEPTSLPKVQKRQSSGDIDSALSQFSDQFSGLDTASLAAEASSLLTDPAFSSYVEQATSLINDPAFSSSLVDAVGSSSAASLLAEASSAAASLPAPSNGGSGGSSGSAGDSDAASKIGAASLSFLGVGLGAAFVFAL